MKIDRTKAYTMPLIGGPLWDLKNVLNTVFIHTESLMFQYETDPDAIPPVLPDPYKPGRSPTVSVLFIEYNGVDFMAGGGYRIAVISVAAQFDGEKGHLEGDYVLIMPENSTLPIITGREFNGMPKIYMDISPIRIMGDGHLSCETSLWGHFLFGIDIAPPLKEQNAVVRKIASGQMSNRPAFGYKYIASFNEPPDADYPSILWSDIILEQLWLGKEGEFYFGNPTEDDIGFYKPGIDALKSLPVRKINQTGHSRGSMIIRNDKNGRLR